MADQRKGFAVPSLATRELPATSGWSGVSIQDVGRSAMDWGKGAIDSLQRLGQIPGIADRIAEQNFPDSARDSSIKNAFRHALGTGMLTQALGNTRFSDDIAKAVGYGWEALGTRRAMEDPTYRQDVMHDLNANAIGAQTARRTNNEAELVAALRKLATESRVETPPGALQPSPGYLTRSVR